MNDADDRSRLLTLMRERAHFRESAVVAGTRSSSYFDAQQVLLDPEGAQIAGRLAYELLRPVAPHAVGGPVGAAGALVCAVSAAAWDAGERWTGFLVRDEARKYGLQSWIDGPFIEEGTPVAVVGDTLATGASLVAAVERSRAAGGVVVAALVAIDRDEGGRQSVEAALGDVPLHALFTAAQIRGE